jgi:hypothetical protein
MLIERESYTFLFWQFLDVLFPRHHLEELLIKDEVGIGERSTDAKPGRELEDSTQARQ